MGPPAPAASEGGEGEAGNVAVEADGTVAVTSPPVADPEEVKKALVALDESLPLSKKDIVSSELLSTMFLDLSKDLKAAKQAALLLFNAKGLPIPDPLPTFPEEVDKNYELPEAKQ